MPKLLLLSVKGHANGSNLGNGKAKISRQCSLVIVRTKPRTAARMFAFLLTTWPGASTNILTFCPHWRSCKLSLQPGLPCHPSPLQLVPTEGSAKWTFFFFFSAGAAWDCRDPGTRCFSCAPARPPVNSQAASGRGAAAASRKGASLGASGPGFSFLASAGGRESTRYWSTCPVLISVQQSKRLANLPG